MSKKPQAPEKPLADRIAKARKEGRTQQALEFAKQYFKQEPTEPHRELLRQVTMERGLQLQAQGMLPEAATVFGNALNLGGGPEFLAGAAKRLAACGAVAQALAAAAQIGDVALRQQIVHHAADGALAHGAAGKSQLPAELHVSFDQLLQAFRHYEAGRDEEARAALQSIGLQSPFLEWKVFLRGLIAYAGNDDARALENWQRLVQDRLPHRLSAPMRAGIDPAFLNAQPIAAQQSLKTRMMQQQGVAIAPALRELRDLLNKENLAPAFRKAELIFATMRRDHPELAPRLAHCFYWAVINHGHPDDLEHYERVFGTPADDPELDRLEALALETRGMWPEAHQAWQDFITEAAHLTNIWPGEIGKRVQAIIWSRMAENADPFRKRRSRSGNPLFDLFAAQTGPLKPSAAQCYENAIKLAPNALGCYRALFELYRDEYKLPKAKKLGKELLKRFPDHANTLEALGELAMDTQDYKQAQEYFEKAIQANPLDRNLRLTLARAKQNYGLALTLGHKFAQAREQYEQAVKLWDGSKTSLLCQWAVAEMKAANPTRAEELIAQAQAEPDHRLACRYALVGESVRAKLSPKEKKRIADDLKTALTQAPSPAEILVLLESAAQQRLTHDSTFHGQKTQERTILKFLEGISFANFNEAQLKRLCIGLQTLDSRKPWLKCLHHARRHHLKNPFFRVSFCDYYLTEGSRDPKTHLAREHLDDARRLVEELPRGEEQQQYLEQIKEREQVIAELNTRNPSMMDVFDRLFGGQGPEFDEDDYGDEDEW